MIARLQRPTVALRGGMPLRVNGEAVGAVDVPA
jgi:uncharacterized protein GlcG (DUF336 family)